MDVPSLQTTGFFPERESQTSGGTAREPRAEKAGPGTSQRRGPSSGAALRPPAALTRMPFTTVMFSFSSVSKVTRRVLAVPPMAPASVPAESARGPASTSGPTRTTRERFPCPAGARPRPQEARRSRRFQKPASSGHVPGVRRLGLAQEAIYPPLIRRCFRIGGSGPGCYGNRWYLTWLPEPLRVVGIVVFIWRDGCSRACVERRALWEL